MKHPIGTKYKMHINFTEYTMVLSEIIENPRKPERKYKLDFSPEYKAKKVKLPPMEVVCTEAELDRLERG
jgi:hypothetical protein